MPDGYIIGLNPFLNTKNGLETKFIFKEANPPPPPPHTHKQVSRERNLFWAHRVSLSESGVGAVVVDKWCFHKTMAQTTGWTITYKKSLKYFDLKLNVSH